MDDKVFELLEKIYSDLNSKMDKINSEMQEGFKEVRQDIVRLENKMDTNNKALYDGYKQTHEKVTEVNEKLDKHEKLIKGHDLEIKVMRKVE